MSFAHELRLMNKIYKLNQDIDKLRFARDELIEELNQLRDKTESTANKESEEA